MTNLDEAPLVVTFLKQGSVEEIETTQQAANLKVARPLVLARYPQAVFVPSCQNEPDGGCIFVYPDETRRRSDETDAKTGKAVPQTGEGYGRWVCVICSEEQQEPMCSQPRSHTMERPSSHRNRVEELAVEIGELTYEERAQLFELLMGPR